MRLGGLVELNLPFIVVGFLFCLLSQRSGYEKVLP